MEENADKSGIEGKFNGRWKIIQEWDQASKERFKDNHDECVDEQKKANHSYSANLFIGWPSNRREEKFKESWRWV